MKLAWYCIIPNLCLKVAMEKPNGQFHKELVLVTLNNSVDFWKQQGSFDGFPFRLLLFEILPLSLTANLCCPAKTFYIQKKELPATWPLWEKCSELFPQCTSVNVTGDRLVVKCESFCHRFFISNKKSGLECLEWDFKAVSSSWFISCQKLSHFSEIGAIRCFIHLLQRLSAQSRDFYRPLISNQESVFCWCSQLVYG